MLYTFIILDNPLSTRVVNCTILSSILNLLLQENSSHSPIELSTSKMKAVPIVALLEIIEVPVTTGFLNHFSPLLGIGGVLMLKCLDSISQMKP